MSIDALSLGVTRTELERNHRHPPTAEVTLLWRYHGILPWRRNNFTNYIHRADSFSRSQYLFSRYRIPRRLCNQEFHYCVHKTALLVPILNQTNPVPTLPYYSSKILVISSSHLRPRASKWSLSFTIYYHTFVCISFLLKLRPSRPPLHKCHNILRENVQLPIPEFFPQSPLTSKCSPITLFSKFSLYKMINYILTLSAVPILTWNVSEIELCLRPQVNGLLYWAQSTDVLRITGHQKQHWYTIYM
jgi:hypothetical protein